MENLQASYRNTVNRCRFPSSLGANRQQLEKDTTNVYLAQRDWEGFAFVELHLNQRFGQ